MASDLFNQNTGSPQAIATYSANWAVAGGGFAIPSGNLSQYRSNTGAENVARWTGTLPSGNHEAIVTTNTNWLSAGYYAGPAVGISAVANDCYCLIASRDDYYVGKMVAGVETDFPGFPLSWSPILAAGDRIKLSKSVSGSVVTLKVWKALAASPAVFTQIGSDIVDSSSALTAGTYGIFGYGDASSSSHGGGPWDGNDLGGGGASTFPPVPGSPSFHPSISLIAQ